MHTPCCPLSSVSAGRHRAGVRTQSLSVVKNGETEILTFPDLKDTNGLVVYAFFQVQAGALVGTVELGFLQQAPLETFGPSVYAPISDAPKAIPSTAVTLGGIFCIQQRVPTEGVSAVSIRNTLGIDIRQVTVEIARRAELAMFVEPCGKCTK